MRGCDATRGVVTEAETIRHYIDTAMADAGRVKALAMDEASRFDDALSDLRAIPGAWRLFWELRNEAPPEAPPEAACP